MVINGKILGYLKTEQSRLDACVGGLRERGESGIPPRVLVFAMKGRNHLLSSSGIRVIRFLILRIINLICILDFQVQTLCRWSTM